MFSFTLSDTRVLNSLEELCITWVAAVNSFTRVLNPRDGSIHILIHRQFRYIYIYIYIYGVIEKYLLVPTFLKDGWVVLGPHTRPAKNSDLKPCDFFIWGRLKPKTLEELEGRIQTVIFSVPQEFLVKSVDAVPDGLEMLLANAGGYIEF